MINSHSQPSAQPLGGGGHVGVVGGHVAGVAAPVTGGGTTGTGTGTGGGTITGGV